MMIKVIERATGNTFTAKAIEGGYELFTLSGEPYKKLKDSTFKRNFKVSEEAEDNKTSKKSKTEDPVVELTDEQREKMMDKIRKILKLAQDNPSMEEGLSAALQAQKLMAKYNIHKEDVELEEIKDEIGSVFTDQKHNSSLHTWRKSLAMIIARNFRCKCYMNGQDVVFRGYISDAKIAKDIFMSLYAIGDRLGSKAYMDQLTNTGSGKGAYNSFVMGFLKGIEEGLGEQCTALMVIVPKEVEQEYAEFSANFKRGRAVSVSITDGELYKKGKVEGKAAVKSRQLESK